MSVNKYAPHVVVLPEDDANRQIVNGFLLNPSLNIRAIQVLPSAGGWTKVRDSFANVHLHEMERLDNRFMILLVDFDNQDSRLKEVAKAIPSILADRVLIVGALSEPEDLKKAGLGNFEKIGKDISDDCLIQSGKIWGHELLRHTITEICRMGPTVRSILFPTI